MIHDSILGTIGNTPVVRINRLAPRNTTIYVKCEAFNPMSSVKDRLAIAMIEDAERRGTLKPGRHIRVKKETPLTNLYLGMLDRVGVPRGRQFVLLGGSQIGASTLVRWYTLHVLALPFVIVIQMAVHFWRVRKDGGISGPL